MKKPYIEFFVGLFLLIGIACLAYLGLKIARREHFISMGYTVHASFSNCAGLRRNAEIKIAGVSIGHVKSITLQDYEAKVELSIDQGVVLQKDAIASIRTNGLIGEKYIEITPGADDRLIQDGGVIRDTEPAMDVEGLISKFVQGNFNAPANAPAKSNSTNEIH